MNCVKSTMKNFMALQIFHWSTTHILLPVAREWFSNVSVPKKVSNLLLLLKKERIDLLAFPKTISSGPYDMVHKI